MNSGDMIQRDKIQGTRYHECNLVIFSLAEDIIPSPDSFIRQFQKETHQKGLGEGK